MKTPVKFRLIQMPCCGQMLCWVNPRLPKLLLFQARANDCEGSRLLATAQTHMGMTRLSLGTSPLRLGLLNAPGDFGWELPTLLPGRDTGEHTSLMGMRTSIE
jgi:hypothetical protein